MCERTLIAGLELERWLLTCGHRSICTSRRPSRVSFGVSLLSYRPGMGQSERLSDSFHVDMRVLRARITWMIVDSTYWSDMQQLNQQSLTIPAAGIDVGYFSNKFVLGSKKVNGNVELVCDGFVSVCPLVTRTNGESNLLGGVREAEGITVEIDGALHFVGPDAGLRGNSSDTRAVLPNYAASSEYRALVKGALYYIAEFNLTDYPHINRLEINVMGCGLPMTTIDIAQPDVLKAINGVHILPPLPGRKENLIVNVKASLVIPQPQGALINYASSAGTSSAIEDNILVVDMGGGTLDWFMTVNRKRSVERSGAHQSGMLQAVRAVCEAIRPGLGLDAIVVDRVDKALRSESKIVKLSGKHMDLKPYISTAEGVIAKSIHKMLEKAGGLDSMDMILLTGGGAEMVRPIMANLLGDREDIIKMDADPVYSNVKGFYKLAYQVAHGK